MEWEREFGGQRHFGMSWFLLWLAFCLHVAGEALAGFLAVYHPTVLTVRARLSWFPLPTFGSREWLIGLIDVNGVFLLLTSCAFRNAGCLRPLAFIFAGMMLLNGIGHTLPTIFGQTVSAVPFSRPAPGFYSSPLLLAGSIYLPIRLRVIRRRRSQAGGF